MSAEDLLPGQVLLVYDDWFVVKFACGDVPRFVEGGNGGKACSAAVEHVPYADLYSHSEVRLYKEGVRVTRESKIPPVVKSRIRQTLAEKASIELEPQPALPAQG